MNFTWVILLGTLLLVGCGKPNAPIAPNLPNATIAHDLTTPQGALLTLEDAYREKNLKKAIACKDFELEAKLMLKKLKTPDMDTDPEVLKKATEVLQLAYEKEIEHDGFPKFDGLTSEFPETKDFSENIVVVTEVCRFPDGGTSTQHVLVGKTANGWRVLNPLDH